MTEDLNINYLSYFIFQRAKWMRFVWKWKYFIPLQVLDTLADDADGSEPGGYVNIEEPDNDPEDEDGGGGGAGGGGGGSTGVLGKIKGLFGK